MSSPLTEAGWGLAPNYLWTMCGEGINQKRLGKRRVGGWELRASLGTGRHSGTGEAPLVAVPAPPQGPASGPASWSRAGKEGRPWWCWMPTVHQAASSFSHFYLPSSPGRRDSIPISWMTEVRLRDLTFPRSQSQWRIIFTPPLPGARNPTIPRVLPAAAGDI